MGILTKIQWKIRRTNLKIHLFDLYLHDGNGVIGFSFFKILLNFNSYSMLSLEFRLPNGAERKELSIVDWDFMFLSLPVFRWYNDLEEDIMWGHKPKKFEKFLLGIAKIFYK